MFLILPFYAGHFAPKQFGIYQELIDLLVCE